MKLTKPTLEDFDFDLPKSLIAQKPVSPRNHSKLLVYRRSDKTIVDDVFFNLNKYLEPTTTIAVNNAKVEKCRLTFNGNREIFILDRHSDTKVTAMVRPGRLFKIEKTVQLADGVSAAVDSINEHGHRTLTFSTSLSDPVFAKWSKTPLPPYIAPNDSLDDAYQTNYASEDGSKAAPTAGLHFTKEQLVQLKAQYPFVELTLHVGLGTFAPIDDATIAAKTLHKERFEVSEQAAKTLNAASHITAIGTTTTRALESIVVSPRSFSHQTSQTNIFIQPDDTIKSIDSLVTNFHLPKSSLLMMVSALTGREELLRIYQHAIKHQYRFFSFGDAMLIL